MRVINNDSVNGLWGPGGILPGDVLLFDYSGCAGIDLVAGIIRSVQARLLADLGAVSWPGVEAHRYSHAAVAGRGGMILEMTSPEARARWGMQLRPGTRLMARRARHLGEDVGEGLAERIVEAAWRDVAAGRRYPYSELLGYWLWSWGLNKLLLGRRFARVFRSDKADVCSGSVWRWCVEAGLFRESGESDLRGEAWYPARLAAEDGRFRTVGVWTVRRTADAGLAKP